MAEVPYDDPLDPEDAEAARLLDGMLADGDSYLREIIDAQRAGIPRRLANGSGASSPPQAR